jgi:hypothetical protein
VKIFTRKDGAEGQREHKAELTAELERRRIADEQQAAEALAASRGPTAEQAEAAAKARVAAAQAATARRNAEIQRFLDLKESALNLAAIAEVERNAALIAGDVETAIACQVRVNAAATLPPLIDEDMRRKFPVTGFHF